MSLLEKIRKVLNYIKPKSPCCDEPMVVVDIHDNFDNTQVYGCPKCNKKWV